MKIEAKIKYEEKYLPTKRHRIPRIREVEETVTAELREVNKENAPVAMVVTDYKSYLDENGKDRFGLRDSVYLAVENELFSEKRDMRGALDNGPCSMSDFMEDVARAGDCYRCWPGKSRDDVLRSLHDFMGSHILIDGVIYQQANEPRYVVMTFGLGHNHGSTAMMISHHYNPNISKDRYFSALERDKAVSFANTVAEARGDTKSVGTFEDINIKVYMPEMIRCDPNLEHGDGNPLLNSLEDLVQASDNAVESGVFVMSAVSAQLSGNQKPSLADQIQSAVSRSAANPDVPHDKGKPVEPSR